MSKPLAGIVAASLFFLAGFAQAQPATPAPSASPPAATNAAAPEQARDGKRFDCSKASAPDKCEARRKEMQERFAAAKQACVGKEGDERRACYREAMCAKAKDPKKCTERREKREQRMADMKKACGDSKGDARRDCMREQFKSRGKDAAK
jgi:hypothetical protein